MVRYGTKQELFTCLLRHRPLHILFDVIHILVGSRTQTLITENIVYIAHEHKSHVNICPIVILCNMFYHSLIKYYLSKHSVVSCIIRRLYPLLDWQCRTNI